MFLMRTIAACRSRRPRWSSARARTASSRVGITMGRRAALRDAGGDGVGIGGGAVNWPASCSVAKSASPTPMALPQPAVVNPATTMRRRRRSGVTRQNASRRTPHDVRVHAGAADVLSDFVDDQHVDVVEGEARHVGIGDLQQFGLARQDQVTRQSLRPGRSRRRRSPRSPSQRRWAASARINAAILGITKWKRANLS